jgi:hypothetical protein
LKPPSRPMPLRPYPGPPPYRWPYSLSESRSRLDLC